MRKITSLAPEQQAQIQPTIDRWVDAASAPIDMARLTRGVHAVYGYMGKKPPVILVAPSPLAMVHTDVALRILRGNNATLDRALDRTLNHTLDRTLRDTLRGTLRGTLGDTLSLTLGDTPDGTLSHTLDRTLGDTLNDTLRDTLRDTLSHTLDATLGDTLDRTLSHTLDRTLGDTLISTLRDTLRGTLRDTLDRTLGDTLGTTLISTLFRTLDRTLISTLDGTLNDTLRAASDDTLKNCVRTAMGAWRVAQWWAVWGAWYEFAAGLGVQFDADKYAAFTDFTSEVSAISAYDGLAIVSAKPRSIAWKTRPTNGYVGRILHNDSGPSIEYADGWTMYHLNNIAVPEWVVTTPADKITPEQVFAEKNVDVQREIIRKVNPARLMAHATEVDRWTDPMTGKHYRLMELELVGRKRRFMYYEHASVPGIWYAQLVPHEVTRCVYARAWQLGMVTREEVANPRQTLATEIEANLPQYLS